MRTSQIAELLVPSRRRRLIRLPGLVRHAFALLWAAAPREFATSAVLQGAAGLGVAVQLLVARRVLDDLFSVDPVLANMLPAVGLLVLTTAAVSFADLGRAERQRLLTELVGRYATDHVLRVAAAAPLIAFERPEFHDRLERARVNAVLRPVSVATGVIGMISAGFAIVGIAIALVVLQPVLVVLVAVAGIPSWLVGAGASRVIHEYAAAQTERDRRRGYLLALLTSKHEAQEVRAFGLGGFLRAQHAQLYDARIAHLRRVVRRRLWLGGLGSVSSSLLVATVLGLLLWFVTSGRMTAAEAGTAAAAVVLLGQRLQTFGRSAAALYEGALFLEDFVSFVDASSAVAPPLDAGRPANATPPADRPFNGLALRDVWFRYPAAKRSSLRGVSIDVRAGDVVALVGLNGSGKTTLAKVLAGLYEPDAGTITWNGVDVSVCGPEQLRDNVAVIFQDFVRYQLTVNDNIAMGRHERYDDRDAAVEAASRAGVHEAIQALADGYDSQLGTHFIGGSDLSLGQWQRVALARAFFRDAPLMILDEPTASLDAEAEAALFADVRLLCRARAVLLISHRMSSVRTADRIYVLDDGVVTEQGTHDELIACDGRYAELFRIQADSYLSKHPSTVGGPR